MVILQIIYVHMIIVYGLHKDIIIMLKDGRLFKKFKSEIDKPTAVSLFQVQKL